MYPEARTNIENRHKFGAFTEVGCLINNAEEVRVAPDGR